MPITRDQVVDAITTVFLASNHYNYGELVVLGNAVADKLGLRTDSEPPPDDDDSENSSSKKWLE